MKWRRLDCAITYKIPKIAPRMPQWDFVTVNGEQVLCMAGMQEHRATVNKVEVVEIANDSSLQSGSSGSDSGCRVSTVPDDGDSKCTRSRTLTTLQQSDRLAVPEQRPTRPRPTRASGRKPKRSMNERLGKMRRARKQASNSTVIMDTEDDRWTEDGDVEDEEVLRIMQYFCRYSFYIMDGFRRNRDGDTVAGNPLDITNYGRTELLPKNHVLDCVIDCGVKCGPGEKMLLMNTILPSLPENLTVREFCTHVVHPLRLNLLITQRRKLLQFFVVDGGFRTITVAETMAILPAMGIIPLNNKEREAVEEMICGVFQAVMVKNGASVPEPSSIRRNRFSLSTMKARTTLFKSELETLMYLSAELAPTITFWEMEMLVMDISERVTCMRRTVEWDLKEVFDLPLHNFRQARTNLFTLAVAFTQSAASDPSHRGIVVPQTVVHHFLSQIGISADPSTMLPGNDGSLTLVESLQVIQVTRYRIIVAYAYAMREMFEMYDRDNSGSLCQKEVSALLADFGLAPRNKKEQDEIYELLASADTDSNGEYSLSEFIRLVVKCMELRDAIDYRQDLERKIQGNYTGQDTAPQEVYSRPSKIPSIAPSPRSSRIVSPRGSRRSRAMSSRVSFASVASFASAQEDYTRSFTAPEGRRKSSPADLSSEKRRAFISKARTRSRVSFRTSNISME